MRILVQRVSRAAVHIDGRQTGDIGRGLLLFVGITETDNAHIADAMARKVVNLRVFPDPEGKSHFDRTVLDEGGELLVVSQFTLYADCRKGRRPSFTLASEPRKAENLIEDLVRCLREYSLKVETGRFGAKMDVSLVNDGPVTIWLDSAEVLPASK